MLRSIVGVNAVTAYPKIGFSTAIRGRFTTLRLRLLWNVAHPDENLTPKIDGQMKPNHTRHRVTRLTAFRWYRHFGPAGHDMAAFGPADAFAATRNPGPTEPFYDTFVVFDVDAKQSASSLYEFVM